MEPSDGIGARAQGGHLLSGGPDPVRPSSAAKPVRQAHRRRFPIAFAILLGTAGTPAPAFESGRADFSLAFKGEKTHYKVASAFLLPGEVLDLEAESRDTAAFVLEDPFSRSRPAGRRRWTWTAPDSAGLYPLRVARAVGGDTLHFNAFVMVPASETRGEFLRGYRIGKYPKARLKGLAFYAPPKGFVRLDSTTVDASLSPHFRLGQFACKQSTALPAYLALRERLILKLELILEKANHAGFACETFHVMSGYRTPYYNRSLGNVKQSAHQFGGAADIFIDARPQDGEMDDLNGDGRSDGDDSALLFKLVDEMSLNEFYLPYLGGIGKYSKNESHGAFVHVDVRGFRAIW